jgi:hypothetical protein
MSASSVAMAALNVATDPCLGVIADQLNQLHESEVEAAGPDATVPETLGIGLCKVVTPLKVVIWAKKNPWIFAVLAGGVVATIYTVGYRSGRRKR